MKTLVFISILCICLFTACGGTEMNSLHKKMDSLNLQKKNKEILFKPDIQIHNDLGVKNDDPRIKDYRNGVYYFECTGKKFDNKLSLFIKQNEKILKLVSIAPEDMDGSIIGYHVVFESRKPSVEDIDGVTKNGTAGYYVISESRNP